MDSAFFHRPVSRIGDLFRDRRLTLGRQQCELARELRIPLRYLEALEASDYCAVPAPFTKPWLRSYSESLGLAWEQLGGRAIQEWQARQRKCDMPAGRRRQQGRSALIARSRLWVGVLALGGFGMVYLLSAVSSTFSPPPLSIDGLPAQSSTHSQTMQVAIRSDAQTRVSLNGAEYITDSSGLVHASVDLHLGENVLVARAQRAHSSPRVVEYMVLVQE